MVATLKTGIVQEPSASTANLTLDASGGVTVGQNLTVTGTTTLSGGSTITGNETAAAFIPSGATVPTNGLYKPAANAVGLATNSTNALYIDASQNVGIGTTSPASLLNVIGNVQIGSTLNSLSVGTFKVFQNTVGNYVLGWSRTDNTGVGGIAYGDTSGSISFYTSNTSSGSERMRIDTSGNVGIGTTSIAYKLDVGATTGLNAVAVQGGATNSGDGSYFLVKNGGSSVSAFGNYSAVLGGAYTADSLVWSQNATRFITGGGSNERMRIDSSGNVGIGTSSFANQNGGPYLTVYGTNNPTISLRNSTTGTGNNVGTDIYLATAGDLIIQNRNASTIQFYTNGSNERIRVDQVGFVQIIGNNLMPYQGAQTSKSAAATLSGAELITGILQYTGAAATVNIPTGVNIEAALTWSANNVALDWWVINTGSGTCTIGANGNTAVGTLTVTAAASAHFRIRRTAINTFTIYRMS